MFPCISLLKCPFHGPIRGGLSTQKDPFFFFRPERYEIYEDLCRWNHTARRPVDGSVLDIYTVSFCNK